MCFIKSFLEKEKEMKKALLWSLVLLISISMIAVFSTTGCKKEVAPAEERILKIGYITRLSVPWWEICTKGFRAAGSDLGFKAIIYDPPQLTVEDQVRVMETWIAAGLDGIMIAPNDPQAPISVINQAIDAGIPVVTGYGVDSPDSKRLVFLGYDAYSLGVALGKGILASFELQGVEPPGKISYHTGGMVSTEDVASLDGFCEPLEAAGFEVIEPVLDEGDAAKATALAAQTIVLYPDLVGMLAYYDYTGPAVGQAVTDADKIDEIVVQGDGFIGEMVPYMESGAIDATIDLVQYEGSYLGGEILYKLIQAGQEGWDDVLAEYPVVDKEIMSGVGYLTYDKVDVEPWPELAWIMSFEEWKTEFPDVWGVIK